MNYRSGNRFTGSFQLSTLCRLLIPIQLRQGKLQKNEMILVPNRDSEYLFVIIAHVIIISL
jgi:hypothetical protein